MDENGQVTVTPQMPGHTSQGQGVEIPDVYDTHNVVAVARLDMAGLEAWRDEISQPLRPGKPVTFNWSIRGSEAGTYRGVVWLWLEFVPKEGGESERLTLLSRPIQVDVVTILGLPGWLARSLSGVGLMVSTVLGYSFVQKWLEKRWLPRTANPHKDTKHKS